MDISCAQSDGSLTPDYNVHTTSGPGNLSDTSDNLYPHQVVETARRKRNMIVKKSNLALKDSMTRMEEILDHLFVGGRVTRHRLVNTAIEYILQVEYLASKVLHMNVDAVRSGLRTKMTLGDWGLVDVFRRQIAEHWEFRQSKEYNPNPNPSQRVTHIDNSDGHGKSEKELSGKLHQFGDMQFDLGDPKIQHTSEQQRHEHQQQQQQDNQKCQQLHPQKHHDQQQQQPPQQSPSKQYQYPQHPRHNYLDTSSTPTSNHLERIVLEIPQLSPSHLGNGRFDDNDNNNRKDPEILQNPGIMNVDMESKLIGLRSSSPSNNREHSHQRPDQQPHNLLYHHLHPQKHYMRQLHENQQQLDFAGILGAHMIQSQLQERLQQPSEILQEKFRKQCLQPHQQLLQDFFPQPRLLQHQHESLHHQQNHTRPHQRQQQHQQQQQQPEEEEDAMELSIPDVLRPSSSPAQNNHHLHNHHQHHQHQDVLDLRLPSVLRAGTNQEESPKVSDKTDALETSMTVLGLKRTICEAENPDDYQPYKVRRVNKASDRSLTPESPTFESLISGT